MGMFVNYCAGVHRETLPAQQVDAILINVPQNAYSDIAVRATLEMFRYAGTKYVMSDSGGYQNLDKELKQGIVNCDRSRPLICNKNEINNSPEHVIEANMKIRPQNMTSLDLPVPKIVDPYHQYVEFMKKLGPNLVWMRETALLRQKYCPEIELFIPIQCYDLSQFAAYIEKPLTDLAFDGLSLPTRNLGSGGIALFLLKFYQMGVRKVHLLSVSNLTGLALAAYFARHVFDWCSVDATTWRLNADNQIYMDPFDLHSINVGKDSVFQEGESPVCDCPWCAGYTFTGIKNIPLTDRTSLLRSHNYYVIQKAGKEFYEHSGDLVDLERCLMRRVTTSLKKKKVNRLIQALSIATYMRDADIKVLEGLLWNL
ncbi:MAG TPA: hypothetical protein PK941_08465 [Paludibacter sp.]|nr:hypothetical protein [Paludibacter sp.]